MMGQEVRKIKYDIKKIEVGRPSGWYGEEAQADRRL
jgi:hypothetical protein